MKRRSGREGARRTSWTQWFIVAVGARLLGHVARHDPVVRERATSHRRPPCSQTPTAEMATSRRFGSPGHGTIVWRQRPPLPGCQSGRRRVLPEPAVELPGEPAVAALEQRAGVAAGVELPVGLARRRSPRAARARRRRPRAARCPAACSHSPVGSSVDPDLRAVEPRGDGGEVAARPGIAHRVLDALTRERAGRDLEARRARRPRAGRGPSSCRRGVPSCLLSLR